MKPTLDPHTLPKMHLPAHEQAARTQRTHTERPRASSHHRTPRIPRTPEPPVRVGERKTVDLRQPNVRF